MQGKIYELEKTYIGRVPYDSDLQEEVNRFCEDNNIRSGSVSIIGAVKKANLGYYSQETLTYESHEFTGGLEILSCLGNVSIKDGKPFAHLHLVVSDKDGKCFGGHLMPGTIVFAGEFSIQVYSGEDLIRGKDKTTGLPLWQNFDMG